MASNIEFETIDEAFPVAGQDNNSQGFRDNFSVIRNSFEDAKFEITDLQDNAARKDEENNFENNTLIQANLKQTTNTAVSGGTLNTNPAIVSFMNGHYYQTAIGGSLTLELVDWPGTSSNDRLARMTVELISDGSGPYDVDFIGEGTNQAIKIEAGSPFTRVDPVRISIEVSSDSVSRVLEFWTYDNGETIYAKHIGDFE